ncbi:hypothetical protein ACKKBG_A30080 [Auxenochlorella protothecoides x Auxenochlorella symbiontica]
MSDTGASDAGAPLAPGLSGGNQSIGQRSATESEALVLARATGLVSECRAELRELRARAKAARSNRERCMAALAAGSEAVGALEEVCSDAGALDSRGERALCALAGRVQGLMDQAEALVDVYGRQGGLGKFASRMFNPGVGAKFEAITAELQAHAKQVRLLAEGDAYSRGRGSSGTASGSLSARGAARGGPQACRAGSEASAMGISRLGRTSGSLPSQHSVVGVGTAGAAAVAAASAAAAPAPRAPALQVRPFPGAPPPPPPAGAAMGERPVSSGPSFSRRGSVPRRAMDVPDDEEGEEEGEEEEEEPEAEAGRASGAWPPAPRHGRSASTGSQLGAAREAARDSAPSTPPDGVLAAADSGLSRSTWADREAPTRTSTVPSSPGLGGSMGAPAVATPTAIPPPERLHRGKAGQSVTALLLIPPGEDEPRGSLGHAWYYVTRTLGGGTLHVVHLSSQVHSEVRAEGVVTALHLDAAGLVWAGHRNGTVRAWEHSSRAPVCDPLRAFHSSVTALTCDERGACWAASSRGNVRCLRLGEVLRGGAPVGCRLSLVGSLRWSGSAAPADAAALEGVPEDGMVNSELLREQAHYGPVSALAAAVGRVWTAGGSSAFVCLREWSQRGELLASNDLRSMGTVNAMAITSPLVRVLLPAERGAHPAATASVISLAPRSGGTGPGGAALATELQQVWQLLTVHDSGMVQVWTMVAGLLRPILRIGERTSPAKGLAVCESLGAVCTSHLDGRLLVRPLPHPKSPGGLTINYVAGSVGQARMPYGEIQASKTGLAHVQGAGAGVVTSSMNGTISLWGDAALRAAASQRGLALMGELSPREAWPLFCYNSAVLAYAMAEASAGLGLAAGPGDASDDDLLRGAGSGASQRAAANPATASAAARAASSPAAGLFEGGDATPWLLDFRDLVLSRVIGEGAFGKVYLGRWQETDVAIKVLTSLQAFGIGAAGATVAGPDGEVRLDPEVLRTLEREVGIMVAIRHPNIILFMGVCLDPACIVTEFCARGSLYDLLKVAAANPDASARVLDWGKRLNMALDAAKGMLHLHSHRGPIIHRDLKSPNLLVDKHWRVKVTDFNLSRLSDTVSVASSMVANNPRWHAPEVIHSQSYSKASDVYAYGLILWELLTWQLPFAAQTPFQIILMVAERGERPPIPDSPAEYQGGDFEGSADYLALMQECWAQQPKERPTFEHIITRLRGILEQAPGKAAPGAGASGRGLLGGVGAASPTPAGSSPGDGPSPVSTRGASPVQSAEGVGPGPAQGDGTGRPKVGGRPSLARASQTVLANVMGASDRSAEARAAAVAAAAEAALVSPGDEGHAAPGGAGEARPGGRNARGPGSGAPPSPFDAPMTAVTKPGGVARTGAPPSPFDAPSNVQQQQRTAAPPSPFDAPSGTQPRTDAPPSPFDAPSNVQQQQRTGAPPSPFDAPSGTQPRTGAPPSPFDAPLNVQQQQRTAAPPSPFDAPSAAAAAASIPAKAAGPPSPFGASPPATAGGATAPRASTRGAPPSPFDAPSTLGTNGGSLHRPSPFDVGVPNPSSSFKVLRPYDLAGSSGRVPGVTSASPASNAGMIAQTFSLRSSQLSSESSATAPNLSQVASGPHTASDDSAEPRTVA